MKPLAALHVLALGDMAERPLCRLLASLGAEIRRGTPDAQAIADAHFMVDGVGLALLADAGLDRATIERWNPALVLSLIHISEPTRPY